MPKELSIKQRQMLEAYNRDKLDREWPKLSMPNYFKRPSKLELPIPATPNNTPASHVMHPKPKVDN